jgi:hypothetical protein
VNYRELVSEIAESYGLTARDSEDGDVDIYLLSDRAPRGLVPELRSNGFEVFKLLDKEILRELHVHAPERKNLSWYDRGWSQEVVV